MSVGCQTIDIMEGGGEDQVTHSIKFSRILIGSQRLLIIQVHLIDFESKKASRNRRIFTVRTQGRKFLALAVWRLEHPPALPKSEKVSQRA